MQLCLNLKRRGEGTEPHKAGEPYADRTPTWGTPVELWNHHTSCEENLLYKYSRHSETSSSAEGKLAKFLVVHCIENEDVHLSVRAVVFCVLI